MIHLFKKVYISIDKFIRLDHNRVVISRTVGYPMHPNVISRGDLRLAATSLTDAFGADKKYTSFGDLLNDINVVVDETDCRFVIYADEQALSTLLFSWYKTILPNASTTTILAVIKALLFKVNGFESNAFDPAGAIGAGGIDHIVPDQAFMFGADLAPDITDRVSVEFLLSTYLYGGDKKDQLKQSLSALIQKDLDVYLCQLREIFFVHLLTPRLTEHLNLPTTPTLSNISGVASWNSRMGDVFTTKRLWVTPFEFMNFTTRVNVRLEALTTADLDTIRWFAETIGNGWSNNPRYAMMKYDAAKLDLLPTQTQDTFTDALLNTIVANQTAFDDATGTFFSLDLVSVSSHLVASIIEARNSGNLDFLRELSLSQRTPNSA